MEFDKGDVVISTYGRDKGTVYIVIDIKNGRAYLVDGIQRKIESPKIKNFKHILKLNVKSSLICDKIKCNEKIPNPLIRKEVERIKQKI